jgi:hypothetical protein
MEAVISLTALTIAGLKPGLDFRSRITTGPTRCAQVQLYSGSIGAKRWSRFFGPIAANFTATAPLSPQPYRWVILPSLELACRSPWPDRTG